MSATNTNDFSEANIICPNAIISFKNSLSVELLGKYLQNVSEQNVTQEKPISLTFPAA
jgi:hypothetical protein